MKKENLQQVLEIAKAQNGGSKLQSELSLELCERGVMGDLKGLDYLVVKLEEQLCRCDITASKNVMGKFSLGDIALKTNQTAVIGYDPKGLMKKVFQQTKIRRQFEDWIPEADQKIIKKVLKILKVAGVASGIHLNDAAIINYLKTYDELISSTSGKTEDVVKKLKSEMPVVKPAFKPSGKTTFKGVFQMMLGSFLGIPAGTIVGVIIHTIGAVICVLVGMFAGLFARWWGTAWLVPLAVYVTGVIVFVIVYGLIGMIAGMVVAGMGKNGQNRNRTLAVLFAIPSAMGAEILFHFIFRWGSQTVAGWIKGVEFNDMLVTYVGVAGFFIAAVGGICGAIQVLMESKFCEECKCYMDKIKLKGMTLSIGKQIADGLRNQNFPAVIDAMAENKFGDGARLELFKCPECGKGFFDLFVKYSTTDWLAGSIPINAEEAEALVEFEL